MVPVVLAALAVAALLRAEYGQSRAGIWLAKPLASSMFVCVALEAGALGSFYGRAVLAGLALSLAGDLLLIPVARPRVFLAGVAAFLLAHVAYGIAFLSRPLSPAGLVGAGVLVTLVMAGVLRWLRPSLSRRMVPAIRAYVVAIGVMTTLASSVALAGGPWQVAAGALMFTASDLAVARDRFVRSGFVNRAWGLPLYYAAQLLLATTPGLVR
jgi:uncharacterized membrane protein YhhN